MKKIILFLALSGFFTSFSFSQKVEKIKTGFEYYRLPLKPVKDIHNYQVIVLMPYEETVKAERNTYSRKYYQEFEDYRKRLKEAEDRFVKELDDYNRRTAGRKVLDKVVLNEEKPVLVTPPSPTLAHPDEMKYQTIFDPAILGSRIQLEGFKNSPEKALLIAVTMLGFESTSPQLKYIEKTNTNKDGSKYTTRSYFYEIPYRHTMNVKLEVPGKGIIYEGLTEKFRNYQPARTLAYANVISLEAYWLQNKTTFMSQLEERAVNENFAYINSFLNDNYGYVKLNRQTEISLFRHKNFNYKDMQEAYESALLGYKSLTDNEDRAKTHIMKAIDLWETAMSKSNLKDKKARINKKVAIGTQFNLAEAYIWVNEYQNAELQLGKLMSTGIRKKDRKRVDQIRYFLNDQKERHKAQAAL